MYLLPEHFGGNVVDHAHDLIGRELVVRNLIGDSEEASELRGIIIETEAYAGSDDPASHAAFRPGGRAAAMFGQAGVIYVYAAYGMYPCLNIVTGCTGDPAAVLIRGIVTVEGGLTVSGPGRLSRYFGVTIDDHGRSIGDGRIDVSVDQHPATIASGPRVGITRGIDTPWRFVGALTTGQH